MARSPYRFYFPGSLSDPADSTVDLPPGESHHLLRVLRLEEGEPLVVFDRDGIVWDAQADRSEGNVARVRLLKQGERDEAGGAEVSLAVSLLKRRATDWMIEKLSELNVHSLQPLVSKRTVVTPPRAKRGHAPERWERIALAAAKQSGRNIPMSFQQPTPLAAWLRRERPRVLACFAHAGPGSVGLGEWLGGRAGMGLPVVVAVGPEGGWTPGEVKAFKQAGFSAVNLGPLVLRAETAAVTVAAACRVML